MQDRPVVHPCSNRHEHIALPTCASTTTIQWGFSFQYEPKKLTSKLNNTTTRNILVMTKTLDWSWVALSDWHGMCISSCISLAMQQHKLPVIQQSTLFYFPNPWALPCNGCLQEISSWNSFVHNLYRYGAQKSVDHPVPKTREKIAIAQYCQTPEV